MLCIRISRGGCRNGRRQRHAGGPAGGGGRHALPRPQLLWIAEPSRRGGALARSAWREAGRAGRGPDHPIVQHGVEPDHADAWPSLGLRGCRGQPGADGPGRNRNSFAERRTRDRARPAYRGHRRHVPLRDHGTHGAVPRQAGRRLEGRRVRAGAGRNRVPYRLACRQCVRSACASRAAWHRAGGEPSGVSGSAQAPPCDRTARVEPHRLDVMLGRRGEPGCGRGAVHRAGISAIVGSAARRPCKGARPQGRARQSPGLSHLHLEGRPGPDGLLHGDDARRSWPWHGHPRHASRRPL